MELLLSTDKQRSEPLAKVAPQRFMVGGFKETSVVTEWRSSSISHGGIRLSLPHILNSCRI